MSDLLRLGDVRLLALLWIVPALIVFYVYAFRRKRQLLERFARAETLARLIPEVSPSRQRWKAVLVVIAAGAVAFALTQPKWGWRWEEVHRKGVDLIVALDVSKSMLAEDVKPSRLERAKREVIDLLRIVDGDRVGLVAFAGAAFVQCPLTLDYGAAQLFLDTLDTELIPVPGTAVGEALKVAIQAFREGTPESKAIILITDGEDHDEGALAAAEEAKKAGIKVFTIGIGQPDGAPIPMPGGGFRKDERGELVLSRLDEVTLQKIALETGGTYVRAGPAGLDLERVYTQDIKGRTTARELDSPRRQRWEERFQWFLAVAIACLAGEALLSERRRRKEARS